MEKKILFLIEVALFWTLILLPGAVKAYEFEDSDWSVSYSKCGGYIDITVLVYDQGGDDSWMRAMHISYVDDDNELRFILDWDIDSENVHAVSGTVGIDGNSFKYHKSHSSTTVTRSELSGEQYTVRVRWYDVPDAFFGGTTSIKLRGIWDGCTLCGDNRDFFGDNDLLTLTTGIQAGAINAPTGLTATYDDNCDNITLSWSNPSSTDECGNDDNAVQIFRKLKSSANWPNAPFRTVDFPTSSYVDGTIFKGVEYDYRVRHRFTPNSDREDFSGFSSTVTGRRLGKFDPPSDLTASDDKCGEDEIEVSWSWSISDPEGFRIERATNASFSSGVVTFNISGDLRRFVDNTVVTRQMYYYRIRSINKCNDLSNFSSSDSGISPATPVAPGQPSLEIDSVNNVIKVRWIDNSNDEEDFILIRGIVGAGETEIDVHSPPPNSHGGVVLYEDDEVDPCQTYSYRVKSRNECGESDASLSTSGRLNPNLSTAFTQGSFDASKGYYTNRVQLEWTLRGRDANFVEDYLVSRRVLGSSDNYIPLQQISGVGIYNDLIADAGVLYEYQIFGLATCESDRISTDTAYTIGFRNRSGQIAGNVAYAGGNAVRDVKMVAESNSGISGNSIRVNGGNVRVDHNANQNVADQDELIIETWLKLNSYTNSFGVIEKNGSYNLTYEHGIESFKFSVLNNTVLEGIVVHRDSLPVGNWSHILGQVTSDSMQLYVNGKLMAAKALASASLTDPIATPIIMYDKMDGYGAQARLWNKSKAHEDIIRDYSRYAIGNEEGLFLLYTMNEGVGNYCYDRSQVSNAVFNRNHGELLLGAEWASDLPTRDQLSYAAYTDSSGNYLLTLPYANAGENYTLTPIFETHEFEPSNRLLFVGDGSTVLNTIDFEDVSSFTMTGTVFYEGTNCPVSDAFFEIDGNPVTLATGTFAKSDVDGQFEIQVPIGDHFVNVKKVGHTFSNGRWPVENDGLFDFQEPLTNVPFKDNTAITLVGRAVGGTVEEAKIPGLGRSTNNIGKTKITLRNSKDCGWITDPVNVTYRRDTTIITDSLTGEYLLDLLPLKYQVSNVGLVEVSNPIDFGSFSDIDLRVEAELGVSQLYETETDSVFIEGTTSLIRVDSISYHKEQNFIYRSGPSIDVINLDGSQFLGEESVDFMHSEYPGATVELLENGELIQNGLLFPVVIQGTDYDTQIKIFEEYVNADNGESQRVPVTKGSLKLENQLAINSTFEIDLATVDSLPGTIDYSFTAADPNLLENTGGDEGYSFTKTLQIDIEDEFNKYSWEPFEFAADLGVSGESFFRAYLLGTRAQAGTNFVTQGPELVDYILRDPPGGESFALFAEGQTISTTHGWNIDGGVRGEVNKVLAGGLETNIGFGFLTKTEVELTNTAGLAVETRIGGGGEYTQSITTETTWSTSANPNNVGAGGDIFIGKSSNYNFGLTDELNLFPLEACDNNPTVSCFGDTLDGFRIGKTFRFYIAPSEIKTSFFLTQTDIINYEIPNLINLRNDILLNDTLYSCVICDGDDPNFGKNNDDTVFGANATSNANPGSNPPSYTFTGVGEFGLDRIRRFNEQIRLWEEALALNEEDKLESTELKQNWSFDGGGSSLERSVTTDTSSNHVWSWELHAEESWRATIGGMINGAGAEIENSWVISQNVGYGENEEVTNSSTVAYTLSDPDIWDRYSVDVYESKFGFGPIFKVSAGETSCPHEGEVLSKYYKPGEVLSTGTVQSEQPALLIDGKKHSEQINIPEDEVAEFVFRLGNNSTQGWAYSLGLLNHTNPGGAIIVNSGTSELGTAPFTISAGQETQQRILIERGGAYEHDSLLFVFHSTCQYDQGNDFDRDIADTAYVSVKFVPACTDITIQRPTDNWILNKSFDDKMNILLSDYNYNEENFQSFTLQYRPSSEALWNNLHTFYKDTTGVTGTDFSLLSTSASTTPYLWNVLPLDDSNYDIRAVTDCGIATTESEIHSGLIDRETIEVFGTPSPADGVLDPDDDILLTMNETIETGGISSLNFDVRGVLNGTELRHETSLHFDGINDYAEIPEYQLQQRSMTIEFWLKRNSNDAEVILSQGLSIDDQMSVSFTADDKLQFRLGNKTLSSSTAVGDDKWHHYAIVYDRDNLDAQIIIDYTLDNTDNNFGTNYSSSGELLVAKHSSGGLSNFSGFIHELRLWSIPRTVAEIASSGLVTMSGRESGLIGNWPLTEAYGSIGYDKVRSRHAQINGATWNILPQNHSFQFDGVDDYLEALNAGTLAFSDETDITIEAWFKTGATTPQSILSNGKADGTRPEDFAWNVYLNENGEVILENDGNAVSSGGSYNDDNWHHYSAVIERTRAVSIYIDGQLVNTGNAAIFKGFAGPQLWIGARGYIVGNTTIRDQNFNGALDEIRIWNTARKPEQIQRDFVHQLNGDELGLQAYYPFDGITESLGIILRNPDLIDASVENYDLTLGEFTNQSFSNEAPPIKLPRLIEQVNFTYSINNDQIFIEVTDPPARVENVTLDVTVRGLRDKAGNFMESPETWIAYIDKNQVFWEEEYFQFEKDLEDKLSFTAKIKNTGGSQEVFNLGNIPNWLTASPSSGLIDPNSTIEVEFTVQPLLNIGEYEQDIFVTTESFGFNERLLVDLKVTVEAPLWEVNPDEFSTSMNITGQLEINDVISTDPDDMVSVWVDGELRGVTQVEFDPSSGKHLVFLTVMSNADNFDPPPVEELEFRAWDASRGRLLTGLMPDDFKFTSNQILGSRTTPIPIEATVLAELKYILSPGWNWISFPLASDELNTVPGPMDQMSSNQGDEIKSRGDFLTHDNGIWDGGLSAFNTLETYKVKVTEQDTFTYQGVFNDPEEEPIAINPGWNWIGVKSEFIIDVPSAMASLDPKTGDLLKGQRSFAIYEDGFGWGGNLDFLEPQKGYMLKYHSRDELIFPGNLNVKPSARSAVKSNLANTKWDKVYKSVGYESGAFGTTMSLTAKVDECLLLNSTDEIVNLVDWQLAAFAEDECRGIIDATWEASRNTYLYYLSIEGDQAVTLNFKLIRKSDNLSIDLAENIIYENNGLNGIPSDPMLFTCTGQAECDEFMELRTVDIDANKDRIIQQVRQNLTTDAELPSGLFLILRAGNQVEIKEDFEVPPSAALEVRMEDCKIVNE